MTSADRLARRALATLTLSLWAAAASGQTEPPATIIQMPAGEVFSECADCPDMVVVPAGEVTLGDEDVPNARETRSVSVDAFALARTETTRGQFLRFLLDSRGKAGTSCATYAGDGLWEDRVGATWLTPPFSQTDDHPVVCVSWEDAQAFVDWLNSKVLGAPYRLPTEAEWEYAARAGSDAAYPWGDRAEDACGFANAHDRTGQLFNGFPWRPVPCDDGIARTSPADALWPNAFGLKGMQGGAWEWTADCWRDSHEGRPADASARSDGDCSRRVLRGGSWVYGADRLRSAARETDRATARLDDYGFRVARDL